MQRRIQQGVEGVAGVALRENTGPLEHKMVEQQGDQIILLSSGDIYDVIPMYRKASKVEIGQHTSPNRGGQTKREVLALLE
ncbi:hypothetical protein M407DRAFT_207880 [Tulasnella calospora MUT 4182]|uniref:Uncharacterized protein n=1 Tax=Tulasnella calospora MUT 4182 TaxID=1051891 RepID=A0A0C3QGW3_9AGAM|nr:hypothetical protein M407DRAFT_207880 [Tulasnella calospora MUT 4182]